MRLSDTARGNRGREILGIDTTNVKQNEVFPFTTTRGGSLLLYSYFLQQLVLHFLVSSLVHKRCSHGEVIQSTSNLWEDSRPFSIEQLAFAFALVSLQLLASQGLETPDLPGERGRVIAHGFSSAADHNFSGANRMHVASAKASSVNNDSCLA